MRKLTLIRHAHASIERTEGGDIMRPLDERGEQDAARIGQKLCGLGFDPDFLLCSTATRAEATARIIARETAVPESRIRFTRDLYGVTARRLATEIERLDDGFLHVAIVGHNPGVTDLHNWLCNDGLVALPPGGLTRLELAVDAWREITQGCGSLIGMHAP